MACLRPISLRTKAIIRDLPYRYIRMAKDERENLRDFNMREVRSPCGQCSECLKERQNNMACRCSREAVKRGKCVFATLTYSDNHLPFSVSLSCVDLDTGEEYRSFNSKIVERYLDGSSSRSKKKESNPLYLSLCQQFRDLPASNRSRRISWPAPFPADDFDELRMWFYTATPSIDNRDFQKVMRLARVRYLRKYGKALPDFSYCACGEYGPRTCRPHIHCLYFGLDYEQVYFICNIWEELFGDFDNTHHHAYDIKVVPRVDSSDSEKKPFVAVSKYISKYITKGVFECDSVKDGISLSPRLLCSKGLGTFLSNDEIAWYRAYDLFGEYDIQSLRLSVGKVLDSQQLSVLFSELNKRSSICVDGYYFSLPRVLRKKLWYVKDCQGKVLSSTIRKLYSATLVRDVWNDYYSKLRQDCSQLSDSEILSAFHRVMACSEIAADLEDSFGKQVASNFYSKSLF